MKVGFIGAGNMARAIARGWGEPVLCSDGGSGRAAALAAELGGRAASNVEVAQEADLVVLCHKPYQIEEVAAGDQAARQGGGVGARVDRRPAMLQQAYCSRRPSSG